MIVMDRLTDKPDWHVKVFDEEIAKKWRDEALSLPVDPLYDEIVQCEWMEAGHDVYPELPKRLKVILSQACIDYVSDPSGVWTSSVLITPVTIVHPRAP